MAVNVILYRALQAGPMLATLLAVSNADESRTKALVDEIIANENAARRDLPPVCAAWVGAELPDEWKGAA